MLFNRNKKVVKKKKNESLKSGFLLFKTFEPVPIFLNGDRFIDIGALQRSNLPYRVFSPILSLLFYLWKSNNILYIIIYNIWPKDFKVSCFACLLLSNLPDFYFNLRSVYKAGVVSLEEINRFLFKQTINFKYLLSCSFHSVHWH